MKKMILKRRKMILVSIIIFVVIVFGVYLFLPHLDSMKFRKRVGNLDSWKKMCNQKEERFLSYDLPDGGDTTQEEYHVPKKTDHVFAFDGVLKVDDGLYLTGIRGLTDWGMMIQIYSRKNMTLDMPRKNLGENRMWNFYLTCNGVTENNFPHKESTETLVGNHQFAYAVTTYVAAPAKINADGTITLVYHTGEKYEETKEIKVNVKALQLSP